MNPLPALPDIVPPAERERWHEMLRISHLVIVLLYMRMRAPHCVTQVELAESLLIDRKTAGKYLRQLSSRNFIALASKRLGYTLAERGASMLEMWGKIGHFSLKESFNLDLKDSKDLKNEGKKDVGNLWTLPSVKVILEQTSMLFEKEVVAFGLQNCDPMLVLAMLAHAYDQRDQLRAPAIFVYQRLARSLQAEMQPDQYLPDKKYRLDPMHFLPNQFLHALGLAALEIVDVVEVHDVGNVLYEDELVSDEILRAWFTAQQTLDKTMEKGHLKGVLFNMVRDEPIKFENDTLYLLALKEAEYLNQHACVLIEALMPGVKIRFVGDRSVSVETEGV